MRRNAVYSLLCRAANCDNDIISAIYNCKSYSINHYLIRLSTNFPEAKVLLWKKINKKSAIFLTK